MGCAASVEAVSPTEGKRLLPEAAVHLEAPESAKASTALPPAANVAVKADGPQASPDGAARKTEANEPASIPLTAQLNGPKHAGDMAGSTAVQAGSSAHELEALPTGVASSTAAQVSAATSSERFKDGEVTVVFVLGGPGCGKGTQCARMVADFGFQHLSAGDLLRAEVQAGSALGRELDGIMKDGGLVPVEVTLRLLRSAMVASPVKRFLIDGFPRAVDQAQAFEAAVAAPSVLLFLECPLETMQARLLKRGESSGRADDNPATIQKRFDTFLGQSLPVLAHYQQRVAAGQSTVHVHTISAVPPPDQVYAEVAAILRQQHHTFVPGAPVAATAPAPTAAPTIQTVPTATAVQPASTPSAPAAPANENAHPLAAPVVAAPPGLEHAPADAGESSGSTKTTAPSETVSVGLAGESGEAKDGGVDATPAVLLVAAGVALSGTGTLIDAANAESETERARERAKEEGPVVEASPPVAAA